MMVNNTISGLFIKLRFKCARNDVEIGTWLFGLIKAKDKAKPISKVMNSRLKSSFITSDVDYI